MSSLRGLALRSPSEGKDLIMQGLVINLLNINRCQNMEASSSSNSPTLRNFPEKGNACAHTTVQESVQQQIETHTYGDKSQSQSCAQQHEIRLPCCDAGRFWAVVVPASLICFCCMWQGNKVLESLLSSSPL